MKRCALLPSLFWAASAVLSPASAAGAEQPVKALPAAAAASSSATGRSASLPAHGLFEGDQLSAAARQRLAELVIDAIGLQVEVALVVPTGPWKIDGSGRDERDLTPARLDAVKRYLAQRGIDPKHIYVESRTDEKIREPRLDVQLVGRPAND